jgi:NADH-quinone oxidoreductase E subunit
MPVEFSREAKDRFSKMVANYPEKRAALLPALHLAQDEFGYIPPEVEEYVARLFGLPVAKVREVVSFYTLYHTKPPGKYVIQICRNISCHLRGGGKVISYLEGKLGIENGETRADGRFTLQEVECLGACEFAPVMQIGESYYGPLTERRIDEVLEGLK